MYIYIYVCVWVLHMCTCFLFTRSMQALHVCYLLACTLLKNQALQVPHACRAPCRNCMPAGYQALDGLH